MGNFKNMQFSEASKYAKNSNPSLTAATATTPAESSGISRSHMINNLINSKINRITDNPFYFFNDMTMTMVTFYNINKEYTTLDEEIDNTYNFIGPASGLRFDKINGVLLYGIQRIELNIDMGEWGTEADSIEGEAYLPPNTFVPYQQSYFSIDYLNSGGKTFLFRVTSVNIDTFPNGANFYKISYKLEHTTDDITPQVINEFQYLTNNIGTSNSALIGLEEYGLLNEYTSLINLLKQFYCEMFFQSSTQTFVFKYGFFDYYFYDPYLIHFIMKNHIFATNDENYVHVCQPAEPPPYLKIDYHHTIFNLIENPNSGVQVCYFYGYGLLVEDPMSLLTHRIEPYYMITYRDDDGSWIQTPLLEKIPLFETDLMNLIPGYNPLQNTEDGCKDPCNCGCNCDQIINNLDPNKEYYRILYTFFTGQPITRSMIRSISNIRFVPCKELYYMIPILIYIIKHIISSLGNSPSTGTNMPFKK